MAVLNALNGRLPDSVLTGLPWPEASYLRLRADAAASAGRLAAAFRAHFGRPLYVSDAYRTFKQQQTLKIQKGSFAATPGTSNHGLGVVLDLASNINVDGSAEHRWMEANGPSFGWTNPAWAVDFNPANGQHEPWHWEYDPAADRHIPAPTPPPVIPAPAPTPSHIPTVQEDDMIALIEFLYAYLVGRPPTPSEVFNDVAMFSGQTPSQIRDGFLDSPAEPGAVAKAYLDILGRPIDPSGAKTFSGMTIRQVRNGIAGSPEALTRK